jgi:hypothetical protein
VVQDTDLDTLGMDTEDIYIPSPDVKWSATDAAMDQALA